MSSQNINITLILQQPKIALSLAGAQGAQGIQGTSGSNGQGVPTGGTTGQVLSKIDNTNYNTQWVTASGGSGGISKAFAIAMSIGLG